MLKRVMGAQLLARIAGGINAGPFEHGIEAAKTGDYATALQLWQPLAELGHAEAQLNLAIMNHSGRGVPQDNEEAMRWYRLAAGQGLIDAQYALGIIYEEGQIVPQSDRDAVRWYRLAAERGHAQAQYKLGFMHAQGQGVPQRFVLAHMWWSLSAAQGHKTAEKARNLLTKMMTPQQIAEAHQLAAEWKPKVG